MLSIAKGIYIIIALCFIVGVWVHHRALKKLIEGARGVSITASSGKTASIFRHLRQTVWACIVISLWSTTTAVCSILLKHELRSNPWLAYVLTISIQGAVVVTIGVNSELTAASIVRKWKPSTGRTSPGGSALPLRGIVVTEKKPTSSIDSTSVSLTSTRGRRGGEKRALGRDSAPAEEDGDGDDLESLVGDKSFSPFDDLKSLPLPQSNFCSSSDVLIGK